MKEPGQAEGTNGEPQAAEQEPRVAILPETPPVAGQNSRWVDLVFALDVGHVRVLELIYTPEAQPKAFKDIEVQLRRLNYSRRSARHRVDFLAGQGLVRLVNSFVLFVNPVIGIEKDVTKLIRQCKIKFGLW